MPVLRTRSFGTLDFEEASAFFFPRGLPGFEEERRFLPIEAPQSHPLLFLQSTARPELCFITLPVLAVDRRYRLALEADDRAVLGLAEGQAEIGRDVLCLAIVTIPPGGEPTANLLAPLVVSLSSRVALQAVQHDSGYSHCQPIPAGETSEASC